MLARYQIVRGKRDPDDPLPEGHRMDTRKHTRHVLRPDSAHVEAFLAEMSAAAFLRSRARRRASTKRFASAYRKLLDERFRTERARFDEIAELAKTEDVYLGCNCPTAKNPDVAHCHTVLALHFMKKKYPKLRVVMPRS